MLDYKQWLEESYQPIGGGALESNINGLWFAKQTSGKGTPVNFTGSGGTKRGRWVGGDLQINRTDGEEAWSDQTLFSDHVDFANTLVGSGAPVLQGSSGIVAYLCWLAFGTETFTVGVNEEQEIKAAAELTAGTFKIQITLAGITYSTPALAITSTQTQVLAAIVAAFPGAIWATANVKTSSPATTFAKVNTTPMVLTFEKELGNQPLPTLTIVSEGLTPGAPTVVKKTSGKLPIHAENPASTGGSWFGILKSVGKTVVYRAQFNDCRTTSLRLEASTASKVLKVTPTIISISPGIERSQAADPSILDEGLKPWIYTEAAGAFEIDGTIYHGQSAFAVLFTWGLNEYYGDEVKPMDVINNMANAAIEGLTLLIDQAGLERFNSQIYGTPTPAEGSAPIQGLPLLGSYKAEFKRTNPYTGGTSEVLKCEMPGVKWAPTLAIPANPAGGAVELSFTGQMRKQPGGSYTKAVSPPTPFRVTCEYPTDNAAFSI